MLYPSILQSTHIYTPVKIIYSMSPQTKGIPEPNSQIQRLAVLDLPPHTQAQIGII